MNKNSGSSNNVTVGVIALLGIISALVVMVADIGLIKDNGQPIFFIVDLIYMAACGVSSYALLKYRNDLLSIGSFFAAGGAAIKAIKYISWVRGNYSYYGGTYDGMGWQILSFLGEIAGAVAFIMFGLMLTKKYEQQLKGKEKLIIGLLAASGFIQLIYPLRYYNSYSYDRAEFFKSYFKGYFNITSFVFLILAFIVFLVMKLQSGSIPVQAVPVAKTAAPAVPAVTPAAAAPANDTNEQTNLELLRKYKELLDADIITREEFDEKKQKLLKL